MGEVTIKGDTIKEDMVKEDMVKEEMVSNKEDMVSKVCMAGIIKEDGVTRVATIKGDIIKQEDMANKVTDNRDMGNKAMEDNKVMEDNKASVETKAITHGAQLTMEAGEEEAIIKEDGDSLII